MSSLPLHVSPLPGCASSRWADGMRCMCSPQITLVGKVLTTNESGLTYGLEIDDGTGKAAVKIWISDDGGWGRAGGR